MTEIPESVKAEIEKEINLCINPMNESARFNARWGALLGYELASKRAEGLVKAIENQGCQYDWCSFGSNRTCEVCKALKAYRGEG